VALVNINTQPKLNSTAPATYLIYLHYLEYRAHYQTSSPSSS